MPSRTGANNAEDKWGSKRVEGQKRGEGLAGKYIKGRREHQASPQMFLLQGTMGNKQMLAKEALNSLRRH